MPCGCTTPRVSLGLDAASAAAFVHALALQSRRLSQAVYAGARELILDRMLGRSRLTTERSFEALYKAARDAQADSGRYAQVLSRLLVDLFEPLETRAVAQMAGRSRAMGGGAALEVRLDGPDAESASHQALVLRVAQRGQRLFTQEDARLAERVGDLLRRALAYDQAVERGRHEERQRIAQDLHDDIGARSLTLMYQARTPEMENYIRHTLQDLKTLARGLVSNALAHGRANRIEAQLRFAADGWLLRMADDGEGQAPQA